MQKRLAASGALLLVAALAVAAAATSGEPARCWRGDDTAAVSSPASVTLSGWAGKPTAVAYSPVARGRYRHVEVSFRLTLIGKVHGVGLALLNTGAYGDAGPAPSGFPWEEPNLDRSFAVGFDTYAPPTKNPFSADGNIYGRPQHEVSLHWNRVEVANELSPVAFEDGKPHEVHVALDFVAGGARVTVAIDGRDAYRDVFVIGPVPYQSRVTVGLDAGPEKGSCRVEGLAMVCRDAAGTRPIPTRRTIFTDAVLTASHQQQAVEANLPPAGRPVKRVILTLSLSAPPGGIDPWDRVLSIYAWDDAGRRYEILRSITSFGRPYTWRADVTDYQSILRGKRKLAVKIDTWVKGWRVDASLAYYWGRPKLEPWRVTTLWSGDWEYGNPADPLAAHFVPRHPVIDPTTKAAKIRVVVTGHGQSPNTDNAAEFLPAWRTLTVDGKAFRNRLWRTDCWLNPCHPQGGTWKYDRAGWCPGALVRPWEVDITGLIRPGKAVTVEYKPMKYVNKNSGKSRASHLVEVQLVEYR